MRERIRQLAVVKEVCKGGVFRCYLQDHVHHEVIARCSGKHGKAADHVVCW